MNSALTITQSLTTIRDWIRYTVSQFEQSDIFFGHGTDNSYDEAVWLVMSALHLPHDTLENFLDAKLTEPERKHLHHLVEQRITKRVPTPIWCAKPGCAALNSMWMNA